MRVRERRPLWLTPTPVLPPLPPSATAPWPACARRTLTPTARMYVDLPPMLGPVTTWSDDSPETREVSFLMKDTSSIRSTHLGEEPGGQSASKPAAGT